MVSNINLCGIHLAINFSYFQFFKFFVISLTFETLSVIVTDQPDLTNSVSVRYLCLISYLIKIINFPISVKICITLWSSELWFLQYSQVVSQLFFQRCQQLPHLNDYKFKKLQSQSLCLYCLKKIRCVIALCYNTHYIYNSPYIYLEH